MASGAFLTEILAFYYTYSVLGISSVIVNGVLVLAIARMKRLAQNRWLILSVCLIAADTTLSLGYGITSIIVIDQYTRTSFQNNITSAVAKYTSLECVGVNFILIFGTACDQLFTVSIAIDRAVAVSQPLWYRDNADSFIKSIVALSVTLSLILSVCSFIGIEDKMTSVCVTNSGLNPTYLAFYFPFITAISGLIVVIYVGVLVKTKRQLKQLKNTSKNHGKDFFTRQLNKQVKITTVISAVILGYCVTSVPAYFAFNIVPLIPDVRSDYVLYVRLLLIIELLITLNTFLNTFLYTWRNQEIRAAVKDLGQSTWARATGTSIVSPVSMVSSIQLQSHVKMGRTAVTESTIQQTKHF